MTRFAPLAALGDGGAQTPPAPPPPPGGVRPMHGHGHMHPPSPPPRGARFHAHADRGETRVDVRCAENEPMRACVDAANVLLDKLGVQAR